MTDHNPFKIQIPDDYFARSAAREYSDDAGLALIREFAQNSCDAKAKNVEFSFRAGNELVVSDDGKGANADTIRKRILTPLESYKDAGSVGGFGKAKELLFFANSKWKIRTQDVEVVGSYLDVTSFKTGLENSEGFLVVVTLPEELYRAARANVREFLESSERPGVTWMLDGDVVTTRVVRPKRALKDFGFCKGYVNPETHDPYVYIRTGGLLTSKKYGHHPREVGRVILEVTGASVDLLTPARDSFRKSEHRLAVDSWLYDLATDYRRTLADELGDEVLFLDDEFVPDAPPQEGAVRPSVPSKGGMSAEVSFLASEEAVPTTEQLEEALSELKDVVMPTDPVTGEVMTTTTKADEPPPEKKTTKSAQGFDLSLMPKVEGVKRITVHTGGKVAGKAGAKWLRANKGFAAVTILAAWATAVRAVQESCGLPLDAVGFCFDPQSEAEFVRAQNGRFALLVNPMTVNPSDRYAADELLDRAVHEAAHQFYGKSHDESWASTEIMLRRKCREPGVRGCIARALRTSEVERKED